jgi:outer membrane protein assembly factor BamA/autotransporter translocation and assembly factor TamB
VRRRRKVALAALGLTLAAALLLLRGWFPQEPARRLLEGRLQAALGPGARVGRLTLRPSRLSATIDDLTLDAPAYRVDARHVRLRFRRGVLSGALAIRSLEIDGLRVVVRGTAPPAPAATAGALVVVVEELRVRDASVVYEGTPGQGTVALDGVTADGAVGQGTLRLAATGGRYRGRADVPLGPARAVLLVSPALDLLVESFEGGLARSRLRASGTLGRPGAFRPDLRWEADVDVAEAGAPFGLADAAGDLRAQGTLAMPDGAAALTAHVTAQALRVRGVAIDTASAALSYDATAPVRATARVDARLFGGAVDGEAALAGDAAQGHAAWRDLDLARALAAAGAAAGTTGRASGALDFRGDRRGTLDVRARLAASGRRQQTAFDLTVEGEGPVAADGSRVAIDWAGALGGTSGAVALRADASGRAVGAWPPVVDAQLAGAATLPRAGALPLEATVRAGRDAVEVQGTLGGLGEPLTADAVLRGGAFTTLAVRGASVDLARLSPDLRGRARVQVDASGPPRALSGHADVRVEAAAWQAVEIGTLVLGADAVAGAAEWTLRAPDWNLDATGRVASSAEPVVTGTLVLADTPLGPLSPLVPGPALQGALTGRVAFEVPLSRPEAATARADVERLRVERGALAFAATDGAVLSWRDRTVAVERLALAGDGFRASAQGTVDLAAAPRADLDVTAEVELDRLPVPDGWTAAGRAQAVARLTGTAGRPRAVGSVVFEHAGVEGGGLPPLSIASGAIRLAGDAVVAEALAAELAGGEIVLDGRVPLAAVLPSARAQRAVVAPGEAADVRMAWRGLRAEELPQGGGDTRLGGLLDGSLALSGGLASIGEMRAELAVPALDLRAQDLPVHVDAFGASLAGGLVQTDPVLVSAAEATVQLQAAVDLVRRRIEGTLLGAFHLRALSPFVEAAALGGTAEADLRIEGPLAAPRAHGTVAVEDGSARTRLLPQALSGLTGSVVFEGSAVRVPRMTAVMGGGDLTLEGEGRLAHGLADARFTLAGRDVTLAYPPGLRSRLDADLTLTGGPERFLLAGQVSAQRALYDLDVVLEQGLSAPPLAPTGPTALGRVALDLRVTTVNPVQVRNNITDLQATGTLRVRGDLDTPSPVGNLIIENSGKVYVQRPFEIERGALAYRGNWDPDLDVVATALVEGVRGGLQRDYQITARLKGSLARPDLQLSSDRDLSEGQIISLLTTGRTDDNGSQLGAMIGGQAAAFMLGGFTRRLRQLGFDEVSLQPELLAREGDSDLGARFTFGKRLSSRVDLVYSLSLQAPESRFILLEGRPGADVALRAQRNGDGTFEYSAGQRFQFGGAARRTPAADRRVRLTAVRFTGDAPLEETALLRLVKARAGKKKTVWDLQDDADRLRAALGERGYLEAEADVRLAEGAATFRIRSGAPYTHVVTGMERPPDLSRTIRGALFEGEALERGRAHLLRALWERGHVKARVRTGVEISGRRRELVFATEPGPRFARVAVTFPGAEALSPGRLEKEAGGAGGLVSEPAAAVAAILEAYRGALHLAAAVDPPVVVEQGDTLRVAVAVHEGPRARFGAVRFAGTTVGEEALARVAALPGDAPYDPLLAIAAVDRVRERYFRLGYASVRIQTAAIPNGDRLDVLFTVDEGRRATLGAVVVRGLRGTSESFVRSQVRMPTGAPIDPRRLASLERRLLDTGAFSRVTTAVSADEPATLTITVEEDRRFSGRYGLTFEDRRRAEDEAPPTLFEQSAAQVDVEARNLLGRGLRTGARFDVGADVREAGASFTVPGLPLLGDLTASVFRIREDLAASPDPATGAPRENESRRDGYELTWKRRLSRRVDLLYGYRHEFSELVSPDLPFPAEARTAKLRASVVRDTRDNILDARKGTFLTLSIDLAPPFLDAERAPDFLASDFRFVKGLAQASIARAVGASVTWAQGYRLGLGRGFDGQEIRRAERFRAGGGNTIRGYATEEIGPLNPLLETFSYGEAVVVVNQELRFRHRSGLGAAVFYDGGNVFAKVEDLGLDWRHALGGGLRWESPVGLLRMDVGFPLSRRLLPFDPPVREGAYHLFFSLGQAF